MLKKLLSKLKERFSAQAKKRLKKKLKKKLRRLLRRVLTLALLACTAYLAYAHRRLILAKLFHKPLPTGECPRKHLFHKKK